MREVTVDADRFGATLGQILGEVSDEVRRGCEPAVREAAKRGRREVKRGARSMFEQHTGDYARGWTYRVRRTADGATAEIGNSAVPGLPHLLEKGHAKVGGGRVAGREHIAPAADAAFDELQSSVEEVIDSL